MTVFIPRFGDGRVGGVLEKLFRGAPIALHLDEMGTAVWRLCDGRRSVLRDRRLSRGAVRRTDRSGLREAGRVPSPDEEERASSNGQSKTRRQEDLTNRKRRSTWIETFFRSCRKRSTGMRTKSSGFRPTCASSPLLGPESDGEGEEKKAKFLTSYLESIGFEDVSRVRRPRQTRAVRVPAESHRDSPGQAGRVAVVDHDSHGRRAARRSQDVVGRSMDRPRPGGQDHRTGVRGQPAGDGLVAPGGEGVSRGRHIAESLRTA